MSGCVKLVHEQSISNTEDGKANIRTNSVMSTKANNSCHHFAYSLPVSYWILDDNVDNRDRILQHCEVFLWVKRQSIDYGLTINSFWWPSVHSNMIYYIHINIHVFIYSTSSVYYDNPSLFRYFQQFYKNDQTNSKKSIFCPKLASKCIFPHIFFIYLI